MTKEDLRTAASNFIDYLIDAEYLDKNDAADDLQETIEDFIAAYKVAPRLIHRLRDISDR